MEPDEQRPGPSAIGDACVALGCVLVLPVLLVAIAGLIHGDSSLRVAPQAAFGPVTAAVGEFVRLDRSPLRLLVLTSLDAVWVFVLLRLARRRPVLRFVVVIFFAGFAALRAIGVQYVIPLQPLFR